MRMRMRGVAQSGYAAIMNKLLRNLCLAVMDSVSPALKELHLSAGSGVQCAGQCI